MEETKTAKQNPNLLVEKMVRNDDIFCSLLFDPRNRTMRVVDFRGGNFQTKQSYLDKIVRTENVRKIFTLIERDDMHGWQRVGYLREGAIPGYYKRSDAYVMGRVYDPDFDPGKVSTDESPERKNHLADIRAQAKEIGDAPQTQAKGELVSDADLLEILASEPARQQLQRPSAAGSKTKKESGKSSGATQSGLPLFSQFSREVETLYFVVQNKRTKALNAYSAEYQDCFGNAKVDVYFAPRTRAELSLARDGLIAFVDRLGTEGAVTTFGLVNHDDMTLNALYLAAGFRNTGWLHRQVQGDRGRIDQILWTRKLA